MVVLAVSGHTAGGRDGEAVPLGLSSRCSNASLVMGRL